MIDELLEQLGDSNTNNEHILIARYLDRLTTQLKTQVAPETSVLDYLFNEKLSSSERHLVAANLLRLLAVCDSAFDNNDLRKRTVNLFDSLYSDSLYKNLSIDPKDQTYQKRQKLRDVVPELKVQLKNLLDYISSVHVISKIRQDFFREITKPSYLSVVSPLIPRNIVRPLLEQVFSNFENYLNHSGVGSLQAYEATKSAIEAYTSEITPLSNEYIRLFFVPLGEKLAFLLEDHFGQSPTYQPVTLEVRAASKKYPFHQVGSQIDLGLRVINTGPGHAYDVNVEITDSIGIKMAREHQFIGEVKQGSTLIELEACVSGAADNCLLEGEISWQNPNGQLSKSSFMLEVFGQRSDVDWDSLGQDNPYSLEPVITTDQLVGRTEILKDLSNRVSGTTIGSTIISGQKRVGKTSVAQTLKTYLESLALENFYVLYAETGDFFSPDPVTAIKSLGQYLITLLKERDIRLYDLPNGDFENSLSFLSQFLTQATIRVPGLKVLFILDEFDELPPDLFQHSTLSDAFFLPIRSITNKASFGFVLIGGERIELVMNAQGEKLNKFKAVRIDYFNKQEQWPDFVELVRRPVQNYLEISDEALTMIYEETSGNPYFTKLLCAELFWIMVARRDSHVTEREVSKAVDKLLSNLSSNSFQHFWEDGIFHTENQARDKSINRRKVLISFGEVLRQGTQTSVKNLQELASQYDLDNESVVSEVRDFEKRQILVKVTGGYECKVPLFEKWLKDKGINEVLTSIDAADYIVQNQKRREALYVKSDELTRLVSQWSVYKGKYTSTDQVRTWLEQFDGYENQRLMFDLLKKLKFISEATIRERLRDSGKTVYRDLIISLESQRRTEILVSYLDNPAKSGAHYARMFAKENKIYVNNVIPSQQIRERLLENRNIQSIVFVDDFMGTGSTAQKGLESLSETLAPLLLERNINIVVIAIAGFVHASDYLFEFAEEKNLNLKVHLCETLNDEDKCFSEVSRIFPDAIERGKAKEIARKYGLQLMKGHPLGYDNSEAIVVFADTCPNNTLPIIWSSSDWFPLFER